MSRPASFSPTGNGAPIPPISDGGKSPFLERAETAQRLELTQKRKSRTEQELDTLVRVRSTTPHMSPFEMHRKDQQIMQMQHQIAAMDSQIREFSEQLKQAELTIRQQQATIRTQSKQIERPRQTNGSMSEPRQHNYTAGYNGPIQHQLGAPPSFNPQASHDQVGGTQQLQHSYGTIQHAQHYSSESMNPLAYLNVNGNNNLQSQAVSRPATVPRITDSGSPMPSRTSYPVTPKHQTTNSTTSNTYTPNRPDHVPQDPFAMNSPPLTGPKHYGFQAVAYTTQPTENVEGSNRVITTSRPINCSNPYASSSLSSPGFSMDAQIADALDRLFLMARKYALTHVNFPNTAGDNALPEDTKQRLLKTANHNTAFPLMKNPQTRYWVVAKVIIQWLVKHVFRTATFSGLDVNVDRLVDGTKASMYQSTPVQLRLLMNNTIANHVKTITMHPQFQEYVQHLTQQRAEALYRIVRPMAHQVTVNDMSDMHELLTEAHGVAQMIYTGADEYSFTFIEHGERFDRYRMMNVDPKYGNCSDDEMRNRWATVRLGPAPLVAMRKGNAQGTVDEFMVLKCRVLLRIKGDE